jgi:hypothetical protein
VHIFLLYLQQVLHQSAQVAVMGEDLSPLEMNIIEQP